MVRQPANFIILYTDESEGPHCLTLTKYGEGDGARAAESWVLLQRTDEGCGGEGELQHECEGEGEGADEEGGDGVSITEHAPIFRSMNGRAQGRSRGRGSRGGRKSARGGGRRGNEG